MSRSDRSEQDREFLRKELAGYPRSKTDFETNYFRKSCGAIKEKFNVTAAGPVQGDRDPRH